jgi:hypothetical protein
MRRKCVTFPHVMVRSSVKKSDHLRYYCILHLFIIFFVNDYV